ALIAEGLLFWRDRVGAHLASVLADLVRHGRDHQRPLASGDVGIAGHRVAHGAGTGARRWREQGDPLRDALNRPGALGIGGDRHRTASAIARERLALWREH